MEYCNFIWKNTTFSASFSPVQGEMGQVLFQNACIISAIDPIRLAYIRPMKAWGGFHPPPLPSLFISLA